MQSIDENKASISAALEKANANQSDITTNTNTIVYSSNQISTNVDDISDIQTKLVEIADQWKHQAER